jgi:hypothetical protein
MGNTDLKVSQRPDPDPDHPKAESVGSRAWTLNQLSPMSLTYLAGLPMTIRLKLRSLTVVLMHGGPDDPAPPWTPTAASASSRAWWPSWARPTAS